MENNQTGNATKNKTKKEWATPMVWVLATANDGQDLIEGGKNNTFHESESAFGAFNANYHS